MLVLSRKSQECIVIDGRVKVKVLRIDGQLVKLGIEAPAEVPVHRQEVYDEIQRSNREALTAARPATLAVRFKSPSGAREPSAPAAEASLAEPISANAT